LRLLLLASLELEWVEEETEANSGSFDLYDWIRGVGLCIPAMG
jgi:hypothetical protein